MHSGERLSKLVQAPLLAGGVGGAALSLFGQTLATIQPRTVSKFLKHPQEMPVHFAIRPGEDQHRGAPLLSLFQGLDQGVGNGHGPLLFVLWPEPKLRLRLHRDHLAAGVDVSPTAEHDLLFAKPCTEEELEEHSLFGGSGGEQRREFLRAVGLDLRFIVLRIKRADPLA